MTEHVERNAERDADVDRSEPLLELQTLDSDAPEVEAHTNSPLCLEV